MTLTQMQYFQAVCRYENLTKAAAALFVSQPTISQAIRDLEAVCGQQLLLRKGNGLQITEAGKVLLGEIDQILNHVDRLQRLIADDGLRRNFVRIGISTFSSSSVFPRLCADFHKQYPDIRIMIHEDSTPTMFHMLDSGSLDLLITAPGGSEQDLRRDYKMHALALSGLKYCVSRNHRWAQRKSVTMEEMAKEPLVMLSNKYSSSQSLVDMFADQPDVYHRTLCGGGCRRGLSPGGASGNQPKYCFPELSQRAEAASYHIGMEKGRRPLPFRRMLHSCGKGALSLQRAADIIVSKLERIILK